MPTLDDVFAPIAAPTFGGERWLRIVIMSPATTLHSIDALIARLSIKATSVQPEDGQGRAGD